MFSSRLPSDLEPNRLSAALADARAAGRRLIDLTLTNPTTAGIEYPPRLLDALADLRALRYAPDPCGFIEAREAVSRDYARRGVRAPADRIVLTTSTSEAYSLLFKLLCDAGDQVLVPEPSYPLFEHLTSLDAVEPVPYRLEYHGRWAVEWDTVRDGWSERVRAVLAVSPNNPTGSVLSAPEWREFDRRCARNGAALIVDEVFADYPLTPAPAGQPGSAEALVFRLGGLSKSAGLPQVKLGWIAVDGPGVLVESALARLALICDTYLSVSTPVQVAASSLIEQGGVVRGRIAARIGETYRILRTLAADYPAVQVLEAEAGWAAVVRVPATRGEEDLVMALLEQDGVVVHPGYFFDFPREAFLVVSLLPDPAAFAEGVRRVLRRADA